MTKPKPTRTVSEKECEGCHEVLPITRFLTVPDGHGGFMRDDWCRRCLAEL
jgi:hypothetical protein